MTITFTTDFDVLKFFGDTKKRKVIFTLKKTTNLPVCYVSKGKVCHYTNPFPEGEEFVAAGLVNGKASKLPLLRHSVTGQTVDPTAKMVREVFDVEEFAPEPGRSVTIDDIINEIDAPAELETPRVVPDSKRETLTEALKRMRKQAFFPL